MKYLSNYLQVTFDGMCKRGIDEKIRVKRCIGNVKHTISTFTIVKHHVPMNRHQIVFVKRRRALVVVFLDHMLLRCIGFFFFFLIDFSIISGICLFAKSPLGLVVLLVDELLGGGGGRGGGEKFWLEYFGRLWLLLLILFQIDLNAGQGQKF